MLKHPQHFGTCITVVEVTFPYSSTAAGVKIDLLSTSCSPLRMIATAIGPAVLPVGTAILPLNVT
jgi:hypothetical protein